MKKQSITFKNIPRPTGLASVSHPEQNFDIKLNKKKMGVVYAPNRYRNYFEFMIAIQKTEPDENPNCDWKWVSWKTTFDDQSKIKIWLKENLLKFIEAKGYTLHFFKD